MVKPAEYLAMLAQPPSIAAVFTDIDGTIIDHDGIMPSSFAPAYERINAIVPVYLATGRSLNSTRRRMQRSCPPGFLPRCFPGVYHDGLTVYGHSEAEILSDVTLSPEVVQAIYQFLAHLEPLTDTAHMDTLVLTQRGVYANQASERLNDLIARFDETYTLVSNLEDLFAADDVCVKCIALLFQEESVMEKVLAEFANKFSTPVDCRRSGNRMLHLTPMGVTKRDGARVLANFLGHREDEVLVIGDGLNDVEMLRDFKHSVAMSDGHLQAVEAAKVTTNPPNENGWADAMMALICAAGDDISTGPATPA